MSIKNSSPKVAIFYDWLNQWGGAERVLLDILKIFPKSDLYTLVYNPKHCQWLPSAQAVYPSFLNRLPFAYRNPLIYTSLYTPVLRHFDLSRYDIIISTTSTIGHQLPINRHQLFICYFHNINRYLYQIPPFCLKPLLKVYQSLDYQFAQNPNYLFCNSKTVQHRIKKNYHRRASVIHPGVNTSKFFPTPHSRQNYFLVVSRLVPHKNINLAISACQTLGLPLKIVGTGRQEKYLRSISAPSTEFLGSVSETQLLNLYQNCIALIHPQNEDFGLACLETQACGRPVIALKKGGALETVIPGITGDFFSEPTLNSLLATLRHFNSKNFSPKDCQEQAKKFSDRHFMLNFKKTVDRLWQTHHPIS